MEIGNETAYLCREDKGMSKAPTTSAGRHLPPDLMEFWWSVLFPVIFHELGQFYALHVQKRHETSVTVMAERVDGGSFEDFEVLLFVHPDLQTAVKTRNGVLPTEPTPIDVAVEDSL